MTDSQAITAILQHIRDTAEKIAEQQSDHDACTELLKAGMSNIIEVIREAPSGDPECPDIPEF